MRAPGISISINTAEFNRWMNGVARQQVPFATAQALTQTAKDAQGDLKAEAGRMMTLRNAHTARGIRIKRADKRDGINAMNSQVGSIDWYVEGQSQDGDSTRTPRQSRYRYIPVKARTNKARSIPKRLKPSALAASPKVFWRHKSNGSALVYQRMGRKGNKLKLLYVAVPQQRIKPKLSLAKTVTLTAQRRLRRNFIKSMGKAIKSAR